ncbi:hypothetical protein [Secundilactobacillus odoratitofui]|uniref:hypothetical protein n=1 Tax=Secundilactobacillus odoratitofui TaxID=480930 RepID=UPI000A87E407
MGLISGWLFQKNGAKRDPKVWQMSVAGVVGSVVNTVLVLGFIAGMYYIGWLPLNKLNVTDLMLGYLVSWPPTGYQKPLCLASSFH